MRYGKDIVKRITEELIKVPSIRHACSKVGINHSTFYRWMGQHFKFHQAVQDALMLGRRNINDAAEGVIISGIQRGDYRSSVYWLSRNNERYVETKQVRYFRFLDYQDRSFLKEKNPGPPESYFEYFFSLCFEMETAMGFEFAKNKIKPMVEYVCHDDAQLVDIFFEAYEGWKEKKLGREEKRKQAGIQVIDEWEAEKKQNSAPSKDGTEE